jgi:CelD/BcsL family acetyltransferase involved in cellulose biosynthesis
LKTLTIEPHEDPRWQRFVDRSPNGSVFHHVEWLRLLRAQYRYPLIAHCVTGKGGEILAGLPFACVRSRLTGTRLVAVPFSDTCAPALAPAANNHVLDALFHSIQTAHTAQDMTVEIRAPIGGVRSSARFYQHELALSSDFDAIHASFSKNVKRGIARASRDGIEVRRGVDAAALDAFYRLHVHTRRRQGMPTQPKRFIDRFAGLFERGLGFVLLAYSDGRPVAAAVFLSFNGVVTYKYGASDPSDLDKRPNHAIFNDAIRRACGHDQQMLDFGRTDLGHDGLRAFKRSWGAHEHELLYTRLPVEDGGGSRGGVPRLVKSAIRRTPPITGRLVGAALYRHFG